jgi:hypothetical protein
MIDDGVQTAATCLATGVMNTKCERDCGHTGTRTIDALGHDWVDLIRTGTNITLLTNITVTGICSRDSSCIPGSVTLAEYIASQTEEPVFLPIQIDLGFMGAGDGF